MNRRPTPEQVGKAAAEQEYAAEEGRGRVLRIDF
jgi:hypothetical protein